MMPAAVPGLDEADSPRTHAKTRRRTDGATETRSTVPGSGASALTTSSATSAARSGIADVEQLPSIHELLERVALLVGGEDDVLRLHRRPFAGERAEERGGSDSRQRGTDEDNGDVPRVDHRKQLFGHDLDELESQVRAQRRA